VVKEWDAMKAQVETDKSVILGLLDLLRDSTDPETQERYKQRVRFLKEQLPCLKGWEI
jgi:hypothetical protein